MSDSRSKLTRGLYLSLCQVEDEPRPPSLPIIVEYADHLTVRRSAVAGTFFARSFHLLPLAAMRATPSAIRALEDEPEVVRIYEDQMVYATLDFSAPHINATQAWDSGYDGSNVKIAIIDTGLDADHPDFADRVIDMADFTGEGHGDLNGHGTHCASIAAGSGQASEGKYRGIAPGAHIYVGKALDRDGAGSMSDVMTAVEWAVDAGVDVISLSLGSPGPSDGTDALSEICDAAVDAGVAVCVAAGNEGPEPYTVGSPGAAKNAITVGAASDLDRIASFSSRGPTADGRQKPDIIFPGVEITAARANSTYMGSIVDDMYTSASGTSMATPHCAGACALIIQAHPGITPIEIKQVLLGTAVDLGAEGNAQGYGRADVWEALQADISEPLPEPDPDEPDENEPDDPSTSNPGCLGLLLGALPEEDGETTQRRRYAR